MQPCLGPVERSRGRRVPPRAGNVRQCGPALGHGRGGISIWADFSDLFCEEWSPALGPERTTRAHHRKRSSCRLSAPLRGTELHLEIRVLLDLGVAVVELRCLDPRANHGVGQIQITGNLTDALAARSGELDDLCLLCIPARTAAAVVSSWPLGPPLSRVLGVSTKPGRFTPQGPGGRWRRNVAGVCPCHLRNARKNDACSRYPRR